MKKSILSLTALLSLSYGYEGILKINTTNYNMNYKEYQMNTKSILDSEFKNEVELNGGEWVLGIKDIDNGIFLSEKEVLVSTNINSFKTKYVGALLFSGYGYGSFISTTVNKIQEYNVKLSDIWKHPNFDLNYFIKTGYREWKRELSTIQKESYNWLYYGIGIEGNYYINHTWQMGISIYGFNTYKPTMKSFNSTQPNLKFDLGNTKGYILSLPIAYKFNENMKIITDIGLEKIIINKSNSIAGFYEPESTSHNSFVKIGIEYKF